MAILYDENRFKKLPIKEDWDKFVNVVTENRGRVIYIAKTFWHNALTRCKGVVTDMPVIATNNCSSRPLAVTQIEVFEFDENTNAYKLKDKWKFNSDYVHMNITKDTSCHTFFDETSDVISIGEKQYYKIKYVAYTEEICSPITMSHLYTKKEKDLALLFTGQLQGQNSGSPFRTVNSVANNYHDAALKTSRYSHFIKRTAPVIQLLTRLTEEEIIEHANRGTLLKELTNKNIKEINENEFYVKLNLKESYIKVTKEELEKLKEQDELSLYYPIITSEQVNNILDNLPKVELDITCIGLGSAGTGILDQVIRGNWFKKFMLIDFDRVEKKNLRNQWYYTSHFGLNKTDASKYIIQAVNPNTEVIVFNRKFQEVDYSPYNTKYIISGFDSIECRLELLEAVEQGKIKAKYLIDIRYDDLTASIFFIDTTNLADMEYYKKGLIADKEAFDKIQNEKKLESEEQWIDYLKQKSVFDCNCGAMMNKICGSVRSCELAHCGSEKCREIWAQIYNDYTDKCNEEFRTNPPRETNSCIKWNLIDIYKYASSFVFAAIRDIEDEKEKQFTHVEVTTDGLPRSLTLRK